MPLRGPGADLPPHLEAVCAATAQMNAVDRRGIRGHSGGVQTTTSDERGIASSDVKTTRPGGSGSTNKYVHTTRTSGGGSTRSNFQTTMPYGC